MTAQRTWTARTTHRRIRRRRTAARAGVAVLLVLGATLLLAAVTDPAPGPAETRPAAGTRSSPTEQVTPSSPPARTVDPKPEDEDAVAVLRQPTTADPLRVWIAGDSMWEVAGPVLAERLEATGVVTARVEVHYSSGLTRPDFFDWPAHVAEVLAMADPELVLVTLGANDSQALTQEDGVHQPGTPGFAAAYDDRVRRMMAQLAEDGRRVVWVGLPAMRPAGYDARMQELDRIQQQAAAGVPGVTFVSTRALFADTTGPASPLRGGDGIHLTPAGADRLADHLAPIVARTAGLDGSPAPSPVPAGSPDG